MASQGDWASLLPQILLGGGGIAVFCTGAFARVRVGAALFWLALSCALAAAVAAACAGPSQGTFAGMLDLGSYARFFEVLLSSIAVVSLLFLRRYSEARGFSGDELYGLLLLATLGMTLTAAATHWLLFFLGLETFSISLYVLIAARKEEASAREAGLKYFVMGAVASAFLTFGIALLLAFTGTLEIGRSLAVPEGRATAGVLAGLALVLVGIGFKISMVPFHLWTPDVYQGAPAPVTAFLSTGSKVALFGALLRLCSGASPEVWGRFLPGLSVLTALTLVVGNVTALRQTRVKRLLAYSSVAQMGYVLLGLVAVGQGGIPAAAFYLAAYAAMDLGAFGIVGTLSGRGGDRDDLDDYRGLGYSRPWQAGVLGVCLFSLAGLPPSAGFIGKFLLFRSALRAGHLGLVVLAAVTAAVSIFFYMKVVVRLYMRPSDGAVAPPTAGALAGLACVVVVVCILWLGILPSPLVSLLHRAAAFLGSPPA